MMSHYDHGTIIIHISGCLLTGQVTVFLKMIKAKQNTTVQDIMDISGVQMPIGSQEEPNEDDERSLMEIEEYLRLGVQLIFDENTSDRPKPENPNIDQVH